MSRGRHIATVCVILAAVSSAGCMSGVESIAADVSPRGWHEPAEMRYTNTDTLTRKEIHLALRHSPVVEPAGGRYVVETLSPLGNVARDTLTIDILPDPQRNRPGEAGAWLPADVRFAEPGDWLFVVTPLQQVRGVWSAAIELKISD